MTHSEFNLLLPKIKESRTVVYNNGERLAYLLEIDTKNEKIVVSPDRYNLFGEKWSIDFTDVNPAKFLIF